MLLSQLGALNPRINFTRAEQRYLGIVCSAGQGPPVVPPRTATQGHLPRALRQRSSRQAPARRRGRPRDDPLAPQAPPTDGGAAARPRLDLRRVPGQGSRLTDVPPCSASAGPARKGTVVPIPGRDMLTSRGWRSFSLGGGSAGHGDGERSSGAVQWSIGTFSPFVLAGGIFTRSCAALLAEVCGESSAPNTSQAALTAGDRAALWSHRRCRLPLQQRRGYFARRAEDQGCRSPNHQRAEALKPSDHLPCRAGDRIKLSLQHGGAGA
jgi:hypothetical protein